MVARTLSLLCCLLPGLAALAQESSFERSVPAPLFSIDGMARAAQVQPDQGACVFVSNALIGQLGDADMLLLRVRGDGTIIQDLTIGDTAGQGYHDVAREVVQANKFYYITGYTRSIDTSQAHTFTSFLIKVDTALQFAWQKNYILPDQEMYAEAMTPVGTDLLIAGKIYVDNNFQSFLMRTDSAGVPIWVKQYDIPMSETIECVRSLPGGDILVSGHAGFGFELVLPFVAKMNAQGDFLWGKYYNYPPASVVENSDFLLIRTASVNDILLAGHTDVFGAGGEDLYVVDIDSSGAVNWARTYGGSQFEFPYMAQFDNVDQELVMVGSSGSFATLGVPYAMAMRIAPNGDLLGAALYGDTSVYQPARFYHSCRVGNGQRLLMGARDTPEDDLYLVGANSTLANNCNYYPVAPQVIAQTTTTGPFTAVVTEPVPEVNDIALGRGHFTQANWLCDMPTAVHERSPSTGMQVWPSPGAVQYVHVAGATADLRLVVRDAAGRVVHEVVYREGMALPRLVAGVYVLEAWRKGERVGQVRFVRTAE